MNILFDETKHQYSAETPDSNGSARLVIPGVTSLLKTAGISPPFYGDESLADFGRKGHKTIALLLRDDLGDYDEAFEPWMKGIKKFVKECKPNKILVLDDTIVYSKRFKYAGSPDFIGAATIAQISGKEKNYVLDWKFWKQRTAEKVDAADIQTSAYAQAAVEMGILKTSPARAVIHFMPGEYAVEPLNDPAAWPTFLSALNISNWKVRH